MENTIINILGVCLVFIITYRVFFRKKCRINQYVNPIDGGKIQIITILCDRNRCVESWSDIVDRFDAETVARNRKNDAKVFWKTLLKNKK